MKKRTLALALVLVMVCGLFAGCGKMSAYATVASAVAKTQTLDAIDVTMDMNMTISSSGMTLTMPIILDMKVKDVKSEAPVVSANLSLSMLGQTMEAQIYQENGWSYTVIGDSKYKTQSEPQTDQYDYSEEMVQVIPEALMNGVTLEKGANGEVSATITIPGEKFMEIYADLVDELSSNLIDAADLTVNDAVVVISVKDGYISKYDMTFAMEAADGDEAASLDVKACITYNDPGKPVEVTPPEGYQDFPEA